MPYEELKVLGKEGLWHCARHKNTQTRLRCGRCEKPICPKCTVMAPTGARCRDCVSNRDAHMYQVAPKHYALAFGAAFLVGALGIFLTWVAGAFWLWVLLYAPAIGPLLGRLVTKITGGKRGPKVALVVSVGLFCGAVLCALASTYLSFARQFPKNYAPLTPRCRSFSHRRSPVFRCGFSSFSPLAASGGGSNKPRRFLCVGKRLQSRPCFRLKRCPNRRKHRI